MRTLYVAVFLVSLAAWLHFSQGQDPCDKDKGPCKCESKNGTKIDIEGVLQSSTEVGIPDPNNQGKYDYFVNFCKGRTCKNDDSGGNDAVACQRQVDGKQNVSSKLGDVKQYSWQIFDNGSFAILYANGDLTGDNSPRFAKLIVNVVDKTYTDNPLNNVTFIKELTGQDDGQGGNKAHVYLFTMYITASEEDKGGSSPNKAGVIGIVLILLVILAILAYFIIGGILMYTVKGARGIEIIPQYTFWKALPGYIKDGFLFTISPCMKLAGRGKAGYQTL